MEYPGGVIDDFENFYEAIFISETEYGEVGAFVTLSAAKHWLWMSDQIRKPSLRGEMVDTMDLKSIA